MPFWLALLTSNAWALLLLVQGLQTRDKERLRWLQRRAVLCAWLAFAGAAAVCAMLAYAVHYAYSSGGGSVSLTPEKHAHELARGVSGLMQGILFALLLMLVPLATRAILTSRAQRLGA